MRAFHLAALAALLGGRAFAEAAPVQFQPMPTEAPVYAVEQTVLSDALNAYGHVVAPSVWVLSAPLSGTQVTEVLVRPGDRVVAGQVLVQLETHRAVLALQEAETRVNAARAQDEAARETLELLIRREEIQAAAVARFDRLEGQGVIAETQIEATRADLLRVMTERAQVQGSAAQRAADLALATLSRDQARLDLDALELRAHTGGIILAVGTQPGAEPTPQASLVTIAADHRSEVVVDVPVARLADLRIGDGAIVILPGGERISTTLSAVPAGSSNGISQIRLELPNGVTPPPGLPVRVEFATDRRNGIAVPLISLLPLDNGFGVLRIEQGRLHSQPVTLGTPLQNDLVEIRAGLHDGDVIVMNAQGALRPGDRTVVPAILTQRRMP